MTRQGRWGSGHEPRERQAVPVNLDGRHGCALELQELAS